MQDGLARGSCARVNDQLQILLYSGGPDEGGRLRNLSNGRVPLYTSHPN